MPDPTLREQVTGILHAVVKRLTLSVAAIIATLMLLAMAGFYLMSERSLSGITEQVSDARRTLTIPAQEIPLLDEQLQTWEAVLASAIDGRIKPSADSDFVQSVLDAADQTGVTLITAAAQRDTVVFVEEREYGAIPYLVRTSGDLAELQAFLRAFEKGNIEALQVTTTTVSRDGDTFMLTVTAMVRSELNITEAGVDQTDGAQVGETDDSVSVNTLADTNR
ncbi:MAG: hypothetical protein IIC30_02685 [Chloroflexi bacterium]|nr:hypothetical protein [Chloroflexota bacterium]